jgi:hypothetical protein
MDPSSPIIDTTDQPTTPSNDNNNDTQDSNNYTITSDEETTTNTTELLATIDRLTREVQLERDNNVAMTENLQFNSDIHQQEIHNMRNELTTLKQQSQQQQNYDTIIQNQNNELEQL